MKSIVCATIFAALLALTAIHGVQSASNSEHQKLKVSIYYETLCPDSMRFIRNELVYAMNDNSLLQFTDLEFIPYGKVGVWTNPDTNITNLYCQHGTRECELNAVHACIVEHNTIREQLDMISCLLNGYATDIDQCAQQLNIDVTAAKNCKATRSTIDILKQYGDKTDAIEISFVPSIGIGGIFDPWKQRSILHNFSRVFCRKYQEKYGITLDKC